MKFIELGKGTNVFLNTEKIYKVTIDNDGLNLIVSHLEVYVIEDTDENRFILGLPLKHADAKTLSTNPFEEMLAKAVGIKPDEIPQKKVKKKSPHSK